VMASLAEFERSLIRERVLSGLRRAKANGTRLGRAPAAIDRKRLLQLRGEGRTVRDIGALMGISKSLVAKLLSIKPSDRRVTFVAK
jgi:DNA invertase Pin-like site-specific DNA recombinase